MKRKTKTKLEVVIALAIHFGLLAIMVGLNFLIQTSVVQECLTDFRNYTNFSMYNYHIGNWSYLAGCQFEVAPHSWIMVN